MHNKRDPHASGALHRHSHHYSDLFQCDHLRYSFGQLHLSGDDVQTLHLAANLPKPHPVYKHPSLPNMPNQRFRSRLLVRHKMPHVHEPHVFPCRRLRCDHHHLRTYRTQVRKVALASTASFLAISSPRPTRSTPYGTPGGA